MDLYKIDKTRGERKMENPEVKKGDKIKLVASKNGYTEWEGLILDVVKPGNGFYTCKAVNGEKPGNITVYTRGTADVYILADRKEQATHLKQLVEQLQEKIKVVVEEINILVNFESEEEYTAHKIDRLLKAKGIKAKTEILKELKRTHIL